MQDRPPPFVEIFLLRTAGPYMWVIFDRFREFAPCPFIPVRPEGAKHQWRKIPPGKLSIGPVADERLVRVTAWAEAS
jgi:hypothetical protein